MSTNNTDIHNKNLKEELKKTKLLLKASLESSKDMIILSVDDKFNYLFFNELHRLMIKKIYNKDIEIGMNALDYVNPKSDKEKIKKSYIRALTGEAHTVSEEFGSSENLRSFETFFNPIFNDENKIIGVTACSKDVSEQKKSEKKLQESEESFKALSDASFGGVIIHDKGLIIQCNKGLSDMTGYSYEELIGMNGLDLIEKKSLETVLYNINTGYTEPYEVEGIRKDKSVYPLCISGKNIKYKGNIVRVIEFRDITEYKEISLALKERELNLMRAQKIAKVGSWDWDPITDKVSYTDTILDIFGISEENFSGNFISILESLIHPKDREKVKKASESSLITGSSNLEYRILLPDGNIRWVHSIGEVLYENGKLIKMIGTNRDITEEKLAEKMLAKEKELLSITLQSIGDGVITTDINGNITMLNYVAENLTEWKSEEAIGKPLPDVFKIVNEITGKSCDNPVEKVLKTGKTVELENHSSLISKSGKEIVIADSGAPILDAQGSIIGVVLVFRDISEKQKLEDSIQREQKLKSLGVLAGGIAHDFNNLLSGIFGYIELSSMISENEEVKSYLAAAINTIERVRALTQQLLTFAKGGTPVKKIENLFPFIKETVKFTLSGSSILSKFNIDDNIWLCEFDKNQIGQVINNLTINALQAMPNGGNIELSAQNIKIKKEEHISLAEGNYVRVSIKDYGTGIAKEELSRIFDPFYTTKPKGHGLGLATCYSIINRHGGFIEVESELNKGSTFHIYLLASNNLSIEKKETEGIKSHKGMGTFVIMDDEIVIQRILKDIFKSFGYTVIVKDNGKDVIEYFKESQRVNNKISGMIFDLTIPGGMGGKEAITEIRKLCTETPVFVASGYAHDPIMSSPHEYGFTASISKPFKIEKLEKMLNENLK